MYCDGGVHNLDVPFFNQYLASLLTQHFDLLFCDRLAFRQLLNLLVEVASHFKAT